jgi:predicted DsbA family dithiol-disulfide isomerase
MLVACGMIHVYFDYNCPFAWRGLELINAVAPSLGLNFSARHYSLHQGNHPSNTRLPRGQPVWKLAEQPIHGLDERQRRTRDAFLASHAARLQGKPVYDQFVLHLFRLRFQDKLEFSPETLLEAARRAELDLERFERDLIDEPTRLTELAADLAAADEIAVFGTPTFVLQSGHAAYFRFKDIPQRLEDQVALWQLYVSVLENDAVIETIKRPRK